MPVGMEGMSVQIDGFQFGIRDRDLGGVAALVESSKEREIAAGGRGGDQVIL